MDIMLFSYFTYLFLYDIIIKMPSSEESLEEIRKRIDEIDDAIADLLSKRMYYASKSKAVKQQMNTPIIDEQRQREVIKEWCERARRNRGSKGYELSEEMMEKLAKLIIEYTVKNELDD